MKKIIISILAFTLIFVWYTPISAQDTVLDYVDVDISQFEEANAKAIALGKEVQKDGGSVLLRVNSAFTNTPQYYQCNQAWGAVKAMVSKFT